MAFAAAELTFGMLVASMFSRAKLAAVAGLLLHFCMLLPRYVFFRTGTVPADDCQQACRVFVQTDFDATTGTLDAHSNIDDVQANLRRFMGNGLPRCQLPPLSHLVRTCSLNTRAPALARHGAQFLPTHSPWQQ